MTKVKLSVVIPTRNRRELIARTLPTILNQNLTCGEYEVVVVSDGSTDGTMDFLRAIKTSVPLRVLERPHCGIAASQNAGIRESRGDLVMVLDDDILCGPTLVDRHIAAHQSDYSCVAFGPRLFSPESRPGLATELQGSWYRDHARRLAVEGGPRDRFDVWLDSNFSVPRSILLAHGGYDEGLRYTEDRELGTRLWDSGVRFKFLPDAPVYEIYLKTTNQLVAIDGCVIGSDEVKLCRKGNGYRGVSIPAALLGESRARLMTWWMCCVPPAWLDVMLRLPCSIAERLGANAAMRRLGLRVLQYRKAIAVMRSAIRETGSWRAFRQEFGMRLPVLRYQRLPPAQSFEAQIRWLVRRGCVGITLSQWLRWVTTGQALPHRPVLINFDGGYAEVAQYALPVLRRHNFAAVVHLPTGLIGEQSKWERASGLVPQPLMTADQIKYWASEGIEFGSLGRSYRRLTELEGEALAEETEGSADDMAQLLGHRPISFSYPHGASNKAVLEQVRRSFRMALGGMPGLNALGTDPHLMHSTTIMPTHTILDLAFAVLSGHSMLAS